MENDTPKSGLIVTPSSMATAIADGRKTLLVMTKSHDIANKQMVLLDRNKAIAVVNIGDGQELDDDRFTSLESEHLITTEIRKDWSEAQPSWERGPFYQWPIEVIERFEEPLETSVEMGPAIVVEDVEVEKRGPFGRFGGSARYAKWLIKQLPGHKKYVEPFAGSAAVFFEKEPSEVDVIADYDKEIVNAFRTIKNITDEQIKILLKKERALKKDVFLSLKSSVPNDSLERLHRLMYLTGGSWSKVISKYNSYREGWTTYNPEKLTKHKERLNKGKTLIECADWKTTIKKHDSKDTLFFIDCPYPGEWDKGADDISNNDRNRGENVSLKEYGDVLKNIKGGFIFVLGDHKEHVDFLSKLEGIVVKVYDGSETKHGGGVKTAKRYFAFKEAGCGDKKPKKKSFSEVETDAIEFLEVGDDLNTFDGMDLAPDLEPSGLSEYELVAVHKRLHEMYLDPPNGWDTTSLVNCHSLVVDEFYSRKHRHPAPPDNGLDGLSFDFEDNAQEQPRWFELELPIEKSIDDLDLEYLEKRRLALWGSTAGKSRVAKKIVAMIPEHTTYVEPFAGGAAVFYAKDPSKKEVLCDSNPEVVHAFKFVQSATEKEVEALKKMDWTVSKPRAAAVHKIEPKGGAERFFRFAYKRYAMFMRNDSRVTAIDPSKEGKSPDIADRVLDTKERLKNVDIVDGSYENAVKKYDSPNTFFYLDPPYPGLVQEVGENEFDEETFIKTLKSIKGKFLLHYEAKAKSKFDVDGWTVKTISVTRTPGHTLGGGAPGKLLEVRNYDLPSKKVKKQEDLYLQVPEGEQPFTVQHHWIGKSLHSDLRIGLVPSRCAIGWTMDIQREPVDEPVTTLARARELTKRASEFCKVDWARGRWSTRKKLDGDDEVAVEVVCKRKLATPYAWLDIEGKTCDPVSGEPVPIGGSPEHPGVFEIVEKGVVEFGAQSGFYHEYFLKGAGMNARAVFRLMQIKKSNEGHCQVCGEESIIDAGWADEQKVALCKRCYSEWRGSNHIAGTLPDLSDDETDRSIWLATRADNSIPFVLTEKAVGIQWMPADGCSALPEKIKKQIPAEYAYWNEADIDARDMRDQLVKAIGGGKVEIDFDSIFESDDSNSKTEFVLQKQVWDDRDPAWFIRLDSGKPELNVIELQSDPVEVEKSGVRVWVDKYKSSMSIEGAVSPAHYLNQHKGVRSSISIVDRGGASILSEIDGSTQVEFGGKFLSGVYVLKRSDNGYLLEKGDGDLIDEIEKMVDFEFNLPIDHFEIEQVTKGKEKRLVTGVVLEPDEVDAQSDTIKADVIEKAAHKFLSGYHKETKLGLMHSTFGDIGIELAQSFIAPVAYTVGKKKVKKGSWVMTVHVADDNRWYDIKNRRLTGFSIGGKARMARKR